MQSSQFGPLPKVPFPPFDGENPRLWITRSEDYFDLCNVDPSAWIRVSTMHFTGPASRWLQSLGPRFRFFPWAEFTKLLLERFGRDQHDALIRQLFHIKQSTTIAAYIEQFSGIVDQLLAYESHTDPRFYTMRFIDGLKDHIKSAVLLQRPSTLDTACALAQLQEEVSEPGRADHRKFISTSSTRPAYSPLPLPRPPQPEALVADSGKLNSLPRSRQMDDKLASLKAYRRARGLCDRCAEKWVPGHRCAPTVQLHALEELWELIEDKSSTNEVDTGLSPPGELLSLSLSAVSGIPSRRTIQFSGECQGHPIVLLVDSGSSHSFVSSTLAEQLSGISPLPHPVTVQVADGGNVSCSQFFSSISWSVQGYTFFTDFRVFPLKTYDAVLGMDWLEQFSPMKINWTEKWLSIPYKGHTVVLQGKYQYTDSPDLFHVVYLLHAMDSDSAMGDVDPKISEVLQSFQPVFDILQGLPPSRSCDHSIPLIQGYQPVFIRPYRYAPAVKDEIERQVNEMLASGIIQHSNSPFSSPVLLVRISDISTPSRLSGNTLFLSLRS
jgi:hypothetical protein